MVQSTVVQVQRKNRITIPEFVSKAEEIGEKDLIKITVEKVTKRVLS